MYLHVYTHTHVHCTYLQVYTYTYRYRYVQVFTCTSVLCTFAGAQPQECQGRSAVRSKPPPALHCHTAPGAQRGAWQLWHCYGLHTEGNCHWSQATGTVHTGNCSTYMYIHVHTCSLGRWMYIFDEIHSTTYMYIHTYMYVIYYKQRDRLIRVFGVLLHVAYYTTRYHKAY